MKAIGELYCVNGGPAFAAGAGGTAPALPGPAPPRAGAGPAAPGTAAPRAPPPPPPAARRPRRPAVGGQSPAPPPRGTPAPPPRGASGATMRINVGCSFETMYMNPFSGSTADRAQFVPPLWPGISIDPRILGGVNNPSLRQPLNASRKASFSASGMKGLMSFSVKDWRAKAGGFVGNGCVGEEYSPGTS